MINSDFLVKQICTKEDISYLGNKSAFLMKLALMLGMSISLLLDNMKVSPCKCCSYTQGMNRYLIFFLEKM